MIDSSSCASHSDQQVHTWWRATESDNNVIWSLYFYSCWNGRSPALTHRWLSIFSWSVVYVCTCNRSNERGHRAEALTEDISFHKEKQVKHLSQSQVPDTYEYRSMRGSQAYLVCTLFQYLHSNYNLSLPKNRRAPPQKKKKEIIIIK